MNLFRDEGSLGDDGLSLNYQTLVRPQLQQQSVNQNLQRQTMALNQRMQALAARPAYNPAGSQNMMATGAAAGRYRYFSHYYPR